MTTKTKGFKAQPAIRPFVATWQNELSGSFTVGTSEARTLEDAADHAFNYGQEQEPALLLIRIVDPQIGDRLQLQEDQV